MANLQQYNVNRLNNNTNDNQVHEEMVHGLAQEDWYLDTNTNQVHSLDNEQIPMLLFSIIRINIHQ